MQLMNRTVINLKSRPDRKAEMERQLRSVGWSASFLEAVRPPDRGTFPSIGARGCFMSHLAALKGAVGNGNLMIIEDDVNFASDFHTRWTSTIDQLEKTSWSICYLGHLLNLQPGLRLLAPSDPVQCSHFMLFRQSVIPTLINQLEVILARPALHPLGGPMHVDGAYTTIRAQNPEIATYACAPVLGHQRASRTDIGDQKWFDSLRWLRPAVSFVRTLKSKLR
jgi:glycosyl transferase, family 25